jgi:hypothetical protein
MIKGSTVARALAAATLAAGAAAFAVATPASAAPVITRIGCTPIGEVLTCKVFLSAVTPPVKIRWSVNGEPFPDADESTSIRIPCPLGNAVDIKVLVGDRTGTASASTTEACGGKSSG